MQQGVANKKVIPQKEVAKQNAITQKKTVKKTFKIKKKSKEKKKSFCDFTLAKVSFIGSFGKFSVTLDLIASKLCLLGRSYK
jgi:hypothetical protein